MNLNYCIVNKSNSFDGEVNYVVIVVTTKSYSTGVINEQLQDLPENVEHLEEAEDDDPDNEVVGGQDASPDTIPSRHKQEQNKIPLCAYIYIN